jgi:DNA polymerase-3 subunit gamma/tau
MGQALYRKYRSRSLEDVIGQDHITLTLKKAIEKGRISHAYLFTGPRGVGKTSVARILAHEINGLTYDDDNPSIDVIEIDAASNRRIDEIRDLRDKVYVAPTSAKYKVYIIDEVHMLTREAFNALLKTLEEPPAHAVFILATTDAHKLPETIVSRTQRFSFKPADDKSIVNLLKTISKSEKFEVNDEAMQLIAKHAGGSFRDSVSLLDQLTSQEGTLTAPDVERMLGLPSVGVIDELIKVTFSGSSSDLMHKLTVMYDQGYQASIISQRLGQDLREKLVSGKLLAKPGLILQLLYRLIEVPASNVPERALEISLLQSNPDLFKQAIKADEPVIEIEEVEIKEEIVELSELEASPLPNEPELEQIIDEPIKVKAKTDGASKFDEAIWPEVLKALKKQYNTLYGVVRMSQPDFSEENKLKLSFAFSFHQKRLNESSNRKKITDILYDLTGQAIDIECLVDKSAQPPKLAIEVDKSEEKTTRQAASGDLSNISNIFGNAELLES